MTGRKTADELFATFVEQHVVHGVLVSPEELCKGNESLLPRLLEKIARYRKIDRTLTMGPTAAGDVETADGPLPEFEGFKTIERIGRGGMGEVFKVRDLRLNRVVAAKVLRVDDPSTSRYANFLREARAMALFEDSRIVRIHEFRPDSDPPVIFMEHVEGFDLGELSPSLEYGQRARILAGVCEAVQRAHDLGIQHRDLKPSNILLDSSLAPKILDFGLSSGEPTEGHLVGTPHFMAPEQLDPSRKIDARTDVHALGVIFYEMLCGERPYRGESVETLVSEIERARPRLPVEVNPEVPEPLQAIALKAMERDPDRRYASAREMAQDLGRFLDGRPVLARPTLYASTLGQRLRPHLEQVEEWLRLKLIYPHEALRIRKAYDQLETREEDWIVEGRVLSFSRIALYIGAFLLVCGALLYFIAHRFEEAIQGLAGPLLVLGLPFAGINAAAWLLYRREHRAVGVAFYLAGVLLLPLFLLIWFQEAGLFTPIEDDPEEFFGGAIVSNRQMQLATILACGWSLWLALRTKTLGLSSILTFLLTLFALSVLTDYGLLGWIEEGEWHRLAVHLVPLPVIQAALAGWFEREGRTSLSRPLYVGAAIVGVAILELVALNGKAFDVLGLSMARFQSAEVTDPVLLDTLTAMTLGGIVVYLAGVLIERYGTTMMEAAAWLLVVVSPYATLKPAMWLVGTNEYSGNYDWLYLALSLGVAVLSHHRQRRGFYFAGVLNVGVALWFVTDHREWFDEPLWATTVLLAGLALLLAGFGLNLRERTR